MPLLDIDTAADYIQRGCIVAYPTEGVYGLGCDPAQPAAVERILQLKARAASKGLILVASSWLQLNSCIAPLDASERARLDASWPGPTTWIVPAANSVSPRITGNRSTIAVRISNHATVRALCNACKHALVSTSANLSGEAPLLTATAVQRVFGNQLDAIVTGELGKLGAATPVFDVTTGNQLR